MTTAYLATSLAGLSALLIPPRSLTTTDNPWVTGIWSTVAIIGGLAGAYAVATDNPHADKQRWRVERWAAPLAVGGAFGYGLGVWAATIETPTRMAQASWIIVVVLLLADRVVEVDAVASRYRALHSLKIRGGALPKEK